MACCRGATHDLAAAIVDNIVPFRSFARIARRTMHCVALQHPNFILVTKLLGPPMSIQPGEASHDTISAANDRGDANYARASTSQDCYGA